MSNLFSFSAPIGVRAAGRWGLGLLIEQCVAVLPCIALLPCIAVLACIAVLGTTAHAQESGPNAAERSYPPCELKPTESDVAAAKGAFQAGTAAYNEADYDRAITYWEDAFRRDCTAAPLLLNLARAYESSSQFEKAITALETFNQRSSDSSQKDQIERRIDRLNEQLEEQRAAERRRATPAPVVVVTSVDNEEPPAAPQDTQVATSRSMLPMVVAIGGGAIALVGTVGYFKFGSDASAFEDQCGPTRKMCPNDAIAENASQARDKQLISGWIAGGGAVIGAAGVVWYFLELNSETQDLAPAASAGLSHVRWTPTVAPGFAGLSVDGVFGF